MSDEPTVGYKAKRAKQAQRHPRRRCVCWRLTHPAWWHLPLKQTETICRACDRSCDPRHLSGR